MGNSLRFDSLALCWFWFWQGAMLTKAPAELVAWPALRLQRLRRRPVLQRPAAVREQRELLHLLGWLPLR